jgi:SagB-type dehydrogenase family enzyme
MGHATRLPEPRATGPVSVEQALGQRRSVRQFGAAPLSLAEVAQLLWAAQGQNRRDGGRTAPSAGALYPLEIYLLAGRVEGLPAGVYRYLPSRHELAQVVEGDRRAALCSAALEQDWFRDAPAVVVIAAVDARTAGKYGQRATRYVDFEAGCASQNLALQAVAAGLGTVVVGAFDDAAVARLVGLRDDERPVALMPVGR